MERPAIPDRAPALLRMAFAALLMLFGAYAGWQGAILVRLGGTPFYLLFGLAVLMCGVLLAWRRRAAAWLFAGIFVVNWAWALGEVGLTFWPLVPRLSSVMAMAPVMALFLPHLCGTRVRCLSYGLAGGLLIAIGCAAAAMFVPHGVREPTSLAVLPQPVGEGSEGGDWGHYGRTPDGQRYAPFAQINAQTVGRLKPAWQFRTGTIAKGSFKDENTPLQIGDTLYLCTPDSRVIALDVDSGQPKWRFDPGGHGPEFLLCRSLGYADLSRRAPAVRGAPQGADARCTRRIYLTTSDGRLIAIDAGDGRACAAFGQGGTVDLGEGLGRFDRRFYFSNSGPLVIEDALVVVGARVKDNQSVGEPSGVVRAFDAASGKLAWAWDLGRPQSTGAPGPGETYTPGTPNMWTTMTYDPALGLVYLPLGNATPDFWGGHRSAASEEYTAAIVAVDYRTGKERWHFRTVNHDVWDYDLPAQGTLTDVPDGRGGRRPVLIQITKRGEIFMLDRRNGQPVAAVAEKPVPVAPTPIGERLAPTQPYSVGMPAIRHEALQESDMWGVSIFDQMACRIAFRQLRYQGDFTPQSEQPTLHYPGNLGGMNWGGATIYKPLDYLIVNDIRVPVVTRLTRRAKGPEKPIFGGLARYPQYGTPYEAGAHPFFSVLGVPCNAPPYGTMTAIDLRTRAIVWQRPIGTTRDSAPLGFRLGVSFPLGMPTRAGSLATGGGLIFFGGATDRVLRALDVRSGRTLWQDDLPMGATATPMTYVSARSGKQYIVQMASGSMGTPGAGDYVIAYSLDGK